VHKSQQLISADSACPRESNELVCPGEHEASIWRSAHRYSTATLELKYAFVPKLVEGAQHGVRVHTEDRREVSRWREAFAGLRFAVRDRSPDLAGDLFMECGRVGTTHVKLQHGLSITRTI
jgi:hypothetical protein